VRRRLCGWDRQPGTSGKARPRGTPALALQAPRAPAGSASNPRAPRPARRRAKEKRERLRGARLAPDYVPLGGASRLLSSAAHGGSGSEDEDGDGKGGGGGGEGGSGSDDEAEALQDRMRVAFIGAAPSARGEGAAAREARVGHPVQAAGQRSNGAAARPRPFLGATARQRDPVPS
jgi:hypothetical protein